MPTAACDQRIICECSDDPVSNYSAENPDQIVFRRIGYFTGEPPLGWRYTQLGCARLCESSVSQLEANLCAQRQAQECVWNDFDNDPVKPDPTVCPVPNCNTPALPPTLYYNVLQTCTVLCADGVSYTYTVPAGIIVALTQEIANSQAYALACQQADAQKICFSTARNLPEGCLDTAYSQQIVATGGIALPWPYVGVSPVSLQTICQSDPHFALYSPIRYDWQLTSGSLPPGIELSRCTGWLEGTPTAAGTYLFTIRITDQAGNYQEKEFQLCIFEITSADPLPDGTVNTAYSQSLATNPSPVTETWSVIAGALPPGLTLDPETGIISGTPTAAGTYNFTVQATLGCA